MATGKWQRVSGLGGNDVHFFKYGFWYDNHTSFSPKFQYNIAGSSSTVSGAAGGSAGFSQSGVDFAAAVGGGLGTIFGAASNYSGYVNAAKRIGFVGGAITASSALHARSTGQLKTSHKIDVAITAALSIASIVPLTAGGATLLSYIYGGYRLVGGQWVDQMIDNRFPSQPSTQISRQ